jgi:hypothetical protein
VLSDPKYFKKGLSLIDQVEAGNGHQTQVAWEWQGIRPKSIRSYNPAWPKTFGSGVLAQLNKFEEKYYYYQRKIISFINLNGLKTIKT